MHLFGMRITAPGKPKPLVVTHCINDQSIAFPPSDRMTKICRVDFVAGRMRPSVHVDDTKRMVAATGKDIDPVGVRHLNNLQAEGRLKLANTAIRDATSVRII